MPKYEPNPWNTPTSMPRNNCYSYAINRRDDVWRNPGELAGWPMQRHEWANPTVVSIRAILDGLVPVAGPFPVGFLGPCIWPVALLTAPVGTANNGWGDYHWLRRDDDTGTWSHKNGKGPATNIDDAGAEILDPATGDFGPYTLVGFFAVNPAKLAA
jgi:hypothetical protein